MAKADRRLYDYSYGCLKAVDNNNCTRILVGPYSYPTDRSVGSPYGRIRYRTAELLRAARLAQLQQWLRAQLQ